MIYRPPRQGFILRRERRGGGTPRLLLLLFQVNELTRFARGPSGAPACWGRGLTHIHGDARNERRGGYVSQATRCLPDPAAFQSLPTACALRLRVISKRGGATDFTYSALIPNLDAQDGIRRACVDSLLEHFGREVARRVHPPVCGQHRQYVAGQPPVQAGEIVRAGLCEFPGLKQIIDPPGPPSFPEG